jgi:Nucleotide-diphospho-sugar transferase
MTKSDFALLVVGNLGEIGAKSLKSIAELEPRRICVLADEEGGRWLNENLPAKTGSAICRHVPTDDFVSRLSLGNLSFGLREFGNSDFIRLTPLKWFLLHECLVLHPEIRGIWFSDLDVIWRSNPEKVTLKDGWIYAQNDEWEKSGKMHFCTGIMYWPNSSRSVLELSELLETQVSLIETGVLKPDEPTFNSFFLNSGVSDRVQYLERDEFVIGHRIAFFLMKGREKLSQVIAFHINYVIGDFKKTFIADTIYERIDQRKRWIWRFTLILTWKLIARLRMLGKSFRNRCRLGVIDVK